LQDFLELALRILNGIITIGFFPFLFQIYRKTSRRFYLLWGVGFLLYGINIVIRATLPFFGLEETLNAQIFSFLFVLTGFILIITGIGELIDSARHFFIASMSMPLMLVILYFTTQQHDVGRSISLMPYVFIALSLLVIRSRYTNALDLLIVGWGILLFDNVGLAIGAINGMYVEVFAIFGKFVIVIGMTSPRFSFLVDDLRRFLIAGLPSVYNDSASNRMILIDSKCESRDNEIVWIRSKVKENSAKTYRTVLISTYDLIAPPDLRRGEIKDVDIFLVRMLTGGRGTLNVFEGHTMTINDDVNELDILFTEIINFSENRKIRCEIILYNLSALIHTHGWKRVYSFLLSKIQQIKGSEVYMYAFYYPNTHENIADISKFEMIFDNIMTIS